MVVEDFNAPLCNAKSIILNTKSINLNINPSILIQIATILQESDPALVTQLRRACCVLAVPVQVAVTVMSCTVSPAKAADILNT